VSGRTVWLVAIRKSDAATTRQRAHSMRRTLLWSPSAAGLAQCRGTSSDLAVRFEALSLRGRRPVRSPLGRAPEPRTVSRTPASNTCTCTSPDQLQRRLGYPPLEMRRRGKVCLGRSKIGTLVGVGLCTGTQGEAQPVHFRFRSGAGMVRRRQAKVDPCIPCREANSASWIKSPACRRNASPSL
jgi:hypothetical protein